jgi:hypothetical protein
MHGMEYTPLFTKGSVAHRICALETSTVMFVHINLQLEVAQEKATFTGVLQMLKLYHRITITPRTLII